MAYTCSFIKFNTNNNATIVPCMPKATFFHPIRWKGIATRYGMSMNIEACDIADTTKNTQPSKSIDESTGEPIIYVQNIHARNRAEKA